MRRAFPVAQLRLAEHASLTVAGQHRICTCFPFQAAFLPHTFCRYVHDFPVDYNIRVSSSQRICHSELLSKNRVFTALPVWYAGFPMP